MIAVNFTPLGLTVDGHAGYAKTGNDIICAAVSALAQGLVHSLVALTDDRITYHIAGGHIDINYKDLSEKGKLLIDSFFIAVSDLGLTYGDAYLEITADGRKTEKGEAL
ncbi:ribosomal-processing cysteine protease Prp [[Ruminococcus] lactaris]|uniref:Ribosomal processing cysteine protease Prp n=1 Tax=[Ruminococcus] lactaris TaxID=46228 RepID=A0A3E4LX07_9FIRM|nr:ribosomal-processing cysteine protease Prp [[Ruminococcus] lactaris]RGK41947.1 ribosomal-processing cysteine protease Prp [[Ruminococcus] lactaris]